MTTPFSSASFPSNPTVPTQAPAGYTTPTTPPNPDAANPPVSSEQMSALRGNLLEMVLRQVVQALVGAFVPGAESAFNQLAAWAANIPGLGPIVAALTGIIDGDLNTLTSWADNIPTNVVDNVALDPGKFFAEAMNVTGLTALWVNTIQPWLTGVFGSTPLVAEVENVVNGILGVADNPTGSSTGPLAQSAAAMVTSTATDLASQASSATQNAVTSALTGASPAATSVAQEIVNGIAHIFSLPPWLTDLVSSMTPTAPGVAAAASATASNLVAAPAAAVQSAAETVDNSLAPAKGLGGEVASVAQNVLGVVGNPSGSAGGSLVSLITAVLSSGALSSGDAVSNIASTLTQALADAASGSMAQANADIKSRFGTTSLAALLSEIVGLFANPGGSGSGGLPQSIWKMIWGFINCNGLTGKGFTAGNNLTGALDNPTGSSLGKLSGFVTDLAKQLFGNGGAALAQLGTLLQDITSGNIFGIFGDLISFEFAYPKIGKDIAAILNILASPALPSPTDTVSGAKSLASSAISSAAGALGLGDTSGGLAGSVTNFLSDFMGTLGNPNGLGTGNVALNELDKIPLLGPLLETVFSGLGGTGVASGTNLLSILESIPGVGSIIEQLPSWLLSILGVGAVTTLLPDATFSIANGTDIAGNGQWIWDFPDMTTNPAWGGAGVVRTARTDVITIYWVSGTWELLSGTPIPFGPKNWGDPLAFVQDYTSTDPLGAAYETSAWGQSYPTATPALDSSFEFIHVNYPGSMLDMGYSVAQGTQTLIALINARPGKFILMGQSQGAGVISNVYDEIRYGSLSHRNSDLLMGWCAGNMRRQQGRTFPGAPSGTVYDPTGYGVWMPALQDTDDRWWEWSLPAGSYPAFGTDNGVTFADGDSVSDSADDFTGQQVRQVFNILQKSTTPGFDITELLFTELPAAVELLPGVKAVLAIQSATASTHGASCFIVQPFLDQSDTRTFWQYTIDHINTLAETPGPQQRRQLETGQLTVTPGATVNISAEVEWLNVDCSGTAIVLGVNAYDADGHLITTSTSPVDASGNAILSAATSLTTISDPATTSTGWQTLSDRVFMPAGAVTARLVFDVEPEALNTGIVWWRRADITMTGGTIDASRLGNMDNMPAVPAANSGGIQGIETSLDTWQHHLDGLASAFSGSSVIDVAFSDVFNAASTLTTAATTSLNALPAIYDRLTALESAAGITPPPTRFSPKQWTKNANGTYTYSIPTEMISGDKLEIAILGAGGGADFDISFYPQHTDGGTAGSWNGAILTYGTDIPLSTTSLTVTVGTGGTAAAGDSGRSGSDRGGDGGASSVAGTGMTTLTAAGGTGGASGSQSGLGPMPRNYAVTGSALGTTYAGGATVSGDTNGAAPGGGGGGGWFYQNIPGKGADGFVSITAYQGS